MKPGSIFEPMSAATVRLLQAELARVLGRFHLASERADEAERRLATYQEALVEIATQEDPIRNGYNMKKRAQEVLAAAKEGE
jgi:Ser/Thr protein kinase RdoA (MazF antagonist)